MIDRPNDGRTGVYDSLTQCNISRGAATLLVDKLAKDPARWVRFVIDFELKLDKSQSGQAWASALATGAS